MALTTGLPCTRNEFISWKNFPFHLHNIPFPYFISQAGNKSVGDDDVVELDGSNGGVDSEEEEEEDAAMGEDGAGGGDEDIAEEEEMQAPQSAAAAAAEAAAAAVLEAHRRKLREMTVLLSLRP